MEISNSTTTGIIGSMFLVASFVNNYDVNIKCASIFFSAHFIINGKGEKL